MKLLIEQELKLPIRSFANKNNKDARWFVAEQSALMFKDGSKYPDKFNINLAFSDSEQVALNVRPFPIGAYQLDDTAFSINRNNGIDVDFSKLRPIKE